MVGNLHIYEHLDEDKHKQDGNGANREEPCLSSFPGKQTNKTKQNKKVFLAL